MFEICKKQKVINKLEGDMKMKKSKVFLRVFVLAFTILMVFSTLAITAPLKVAMILPHSITSEGWTKSGFDGLIDRKSVV